MNTNLYNTPTPSPTQASGPGPGPKKRTPMMAFVLLFIGIALLVGVLVFAVTLGVLQQSKSNPQGQATGTPGVNGTVPPGTVPAATTSPYGFTILRHFTPDTVAYFKQLGVTWVRFQEDWSGIEPQPGQFNWSTLDATVQLANNSGIHIDFPLQLAPDWAKSQKCGGTAILPGPTEMAGFATAVAQRYNGKNKHGYIDSYEIGNEEFDEHLPLNKNIVAQSCSQQNFASFYGPVLKAGYQAIKAQSPNASVGMFGLWWSNIPHIQSYMTWLYQNGYGKYFDYANFHYYPCAGNPGIQGGNPMVTVAQVPSFNAEWQTMYAIMANHGDAHKPIWVTETGWTISSVNQSKRCIVSQQQQSQYMQYVLTQAANSHVVQHVFWYTINSKNDGMSITQFTSKLPSFTTLQQFIQQRPSWN